MTMSVGIVARNEEKHLQLLFDDIKKQEFNLKNVELVLIDSMSKDNTLPLMEKFRKQELENFSDIKILKNEKISQSAGWNVAISAFTGETLTRLDAHSSINKKFFKSIKEALDKGEDVVGGPRGSIVEGNSRWIKLLYAAETSMFGSGVASYRKKGKKDSYKKSMFHATYRREVLKKVGFFNENLGRTEDNDYHYRVREMGYKLFYSNNIKSYQYVRPTLKKMIKQKYGNGYWIGRTIYVQPKCISVFHLVPFLFLVFSIILAGLSFTQKNFIFLLLLISLYLLFCVLSAVVSYKKDKNLYLFFFPVILYTLHISYGIGTLIGLLKGGKNVRDE